MPKPMPKLYRMYRTIGWVVFGCVLAAGILGVGLSAIINASLNQSGSQLDVLFRGSDPSALPNPANTTPNSPGN
jgi:ABC-type siderophore export system fused ATPase/permease subunit